VSKRIVVLLAVVAALAVAAGAALPRSRRAPASEGRFVTRTSPYTLGQAADWLDPRHVVYQDPLVRDEGSDGQTQIYRSTLDGRDKSCLTCGLAGPNQVPIVQPHGHWILFHSWNGHRARIGGPGFGGIGSDVWVMTRDGRRRTNLTRTAELHDNFHAYWSPDGRYLAWTALDWNPTDGGTGRSEVRVARFDSRGPRLVDEHSVRPPNGHWYETQWWAPDGSGFLYTETADTAINPELYFCRLPDPARGRCRPQRLTRNPAWDEQATFTPDMSRIVFMSSRGLPGAQNDWSKVAGFLHIPATYDYLLVLSVFNQGFLQPKLEQATDLYELKLRWNHARTRFREAGLRRLTRTGRDGWIIPEFAWDPSGRRLLWTENKIPDGVRIDQGCVMRELRRGFVDRLRAVKGISQIPFGIDTEIRARAAELLEDPSAYSYRGACGGTRPAGQGPRFAQRTVIGRYVR
jgi:hypothetical protein